MRALPRKPGIVAASGRPVKVPLIAPAAALSRIRNDSPTVGVNEAREDSDSVTLPAIVTPPLETLPWSCPVPGVVPPIPIEYAELALSVRAPFVSLPGDVPGWSVPEMLTVPPMVPEPVRVAPAATLTALASVPPLTSSVPPLTVVAPL